MSMGALLSMREDSVDYMRFELVVYITCLSVLAGADIALSIAQANDFLLPLFLC